MIARLGYRGLEVSTRAFNCRRGLRLDPTANPAEQFYSAQSLAFLSPAILERRHDGCHRLARSEKESSPSTPYASGPTGKHANGCS
jgi:hypothetical protein